MFFGLSIIWQSPNKLLKIEEFPVFHKRKNSLEIGTSAFRLVFYELLYKLCFVEMWGICIYPWKVNYFLPPKTMPLKKRGHILLRPYSVSGSEVCSQFSSECRTPLEVACSCETSAASVIGALLPRGDPRTGITLELEKRRLSTHPDCRVRTCGEQPPVLVQSVTWVMFVVLGESLPTPNAGGHWASQGQLRAQHGKCGGHVCICAFRVQ